MGRAHIPTSRPRTPAFGPPFATPFATLRVAVAACALLALFPLQAAAQCLPTALPPEFAPPCTQRYPRWTGEIASLGVNSLLGAVSAGVQQELRGGSFRDGFARGAAGGSVIYVAKRIVAGQFDGAGLIGRELGSIGASIVRNAGAGQPSFSEIVLPIGVARLYVRPKQRSLRIRPDMTAIGWTIAGLTKEGLRLDVSKSLYAGTPVFFADNKILIINTDSAHVGGVTNSGVVYLANVPAFGPNVARINSKHELVHMVQEDQLFLTVTEPFEDWAIGKLPTVGPFIVRYIDVNIATNLLDLLAGELPKFLNRPWETEAVFRAR